jgi:hypothetical protein
MLTHGGTTIAASNDGVLSTSFYAFFRILRFTLLHLLLLRTFKIHCLHGISVALRPLVSKIFGKYNVLKSEEISFSH